MSTAIGHRLCVCLSTILMGLTPIMVSGAANAAVGASLDQTFDPAQDEALREQQRQIQLEQQRLEQERTTSFDQNTQITLLGNALVGSSITLSNSLNWIVTEEDVQKNKNALLEVRQKGKVRFRGEVFVAEGLTKRVEVPL